MRLIVFIGLCAALWYGYQEYIEYSYLSAFDSSDIPSGSLLNEQPLQKSITNKTIREDNFKLELFAEFRLDALVLGSEHYYMDAESQISPVDLALGWGPMSKPAVVRQLSISQSGRFYHYRWPNTPPIPAQNITVNSANMHMIPATDIIRDKLKSVKRGQYVHLNGYLTNVFRDDGWRWFSSTTRHDSGKGACEVVYVTSIEVF